MLNKDMFLNNRIDMDIQGDSINILKNIFNDIYKMESIKEESKTVEIPIELLQSIRNLIEVTNDRIKWKTEELLPVGVMIKQIDDIFKKNKDSDISIKDS